MPRTSPIASAIPEEVQEELLRLGRNIRTARMRRRLRLVDLAERIGVSRYVLSDIEKGKATTAVASYLGALWALGLLDQMNDVGSPDRDEHGKALERVRSPKRARIVRALDDDF